MPQLSGKPGVRWKYTMPGEENQKTGDAHLSPCKREAVKDLDYLVSTEPARPFFDCFRGPGLFFILRRQRAVPNIRQGSRANSRTFHR